MELEFKDFHHIKNVIESCETLDHLNNTFKWLMNIAFKTKGLDFERIMLYIKRVQFLEEQMIKNGIECTICKVKEKQNLLLTKPKRNSNIKNMRKLYKEK